MTTQGPITGSAGGEHAERFTHLRPLLFTIVYEILGSATESDDVLQDSYLRWAEVDLATVRDTKSYLAQLVTRQALKIYRETVPHQKSDPVWWGRKGPLNYGGLYKIFKRLADKVDLGDENFNPHAWRHAFGRDTTRAGIPNPIACTSGAATRTSSTASAKMSSVSCRSAPRQVRWTRWWTTI